MKITDVEVTKLKIPFFDGGSGEGITPSKWDRLDFVLVRIETSGGIVGWGEAFGYFCSDAVEAVICQLIRPLLIGRDPREPEVLNEELQQKLALFGRYGITIFGLSGIDIALWDIKAKAEGVSLGTLFGAPERKSVPAYASLVRYGDPVIAARTCGRAASEGFSAIKLHEITESDIRACVDALQGAVPLSVDVNCGWTVEFTRKMIPKLLSMDVMWLEEPIFPPEDFMTLAAFRHTGIPIATGENACTAFQFRQIVANQAADFLQPSITKVGGVTEFAKVGRICHETGLAFMPHSPYFGPGYLATLQMAAVMPSFRLFEFLYVEPEAFLYPAMPLPEQGKIPIPTGPGLGFDPDSEVIARYRID